MKPLVDKAEISQLQYDSYVAAAKVAESDLQAAQEKLASAQKDAAIRKAALDSALSQGQYRQGASGDQPGQPQAGAIRTADAGTAAAAVEAARARLEAAELTLSYTTITAPIDGMVTRKSVEVGQIVQPGQGLMTIIPLQDIWVTANFKETQLADVKPGQQAEIHVDMYGKSVHRPRGFHRRRHRFAHEPAAAGERHRQFRESGAAHPGEDSGGPDRRPDSASGHERRRDHLHAIIGI